MTLNGASLQQIAYELRKRAQRHRAKLTSTNTLSFLNFYRPQLPDELDEIADELEALSDYE